MSRRSIVIIGAGHAGVQAAASLREEGSDDAIVLISGEPDLPYQRPPLSKAFLKGAMDLAGLPLRAEQFYREKQIDLRLGVQATRIDLAARRVELGAGGAEPFDHLILATGARPRPFAIPGADLDGVLGLRNIADAAAIRERLGPGRRVVVIGAGFIGLEIAATALARRRRSDGGRDRPPARPRRVAADLGLLPRRAPGVRRALPPRRRRQRDRRRERRSRRRRRSPTASGSPPTSSSSASACWPTTGWRAPRGSPATTAIVVDALLAASDPAVSAIGDCALFPQHSVGQMLRLESVQNATDQARCVARRLTGKPAPYAALPWFWSDQGDLKLQIAGLSHGVDRWMLRGDPKDRAFAAFGFRAGALAAVETVNRGAEHMAARRIIGGGLPISPEEAADPAFDLRKLALSAKA